MNRLPRIVLIVSTAVGSWLAMQAIHEFGHVIGVCLTGGSGPRGLASARAVTSGTDPEPESIGGRLDRAFIRCRDTVPRLFGVLTVPPFYWVWHVRGQHFGFGQAKGNVSRGVAYGSLLVRVGLFVLGMFLVESECLVRDIASSPWHLCLSITKK